MGRATMGGQVRKAKRRIDYVAAKGRKQISAEVPAELVAEIDQIAEENDVARQTLVLWALRDYVKRYPKIVQAKALVS